MTLATDTRKGRAAGAIAPEPEMADNIALSIDRLNADYGSVLAVQDVTLPIVRRSTTAIMGPSGCGKPHLTRYPDTGIHRADRYGFGRGMQSRKIGLGARLAGVAYGCRRKSTFTFHTVADHAPLRVVAAPASFKS